MSSSLTQCRLRRGDETYVAWIDSKFAKIGQPVAVIDSLLGAPFDEKGFSTGWIVEQTYSKLPEKYALDRSQDHKRTRKASDI